MSNLLKKLLVNRQLIIALSIVTFVGSNSANAMDLRLVGAFGSSKISDTVNGSGLPTAGTATLSATETSKSAFGGGALLGLDLMPMFEFETGMLYKSKKWQTSVDVTVAGTTTNTTTEYTGKVIEVPAVIRWNPIPFVSVGFGGYADIGTGEITAGSTSESWGTAGFKNQDYGLVFSGALKYPVAPLTSIYLDGRYLMGLNDVNSELDATSPTITQKFRTVEVLAGVQFHL